MSRLARLLPVLMSTASYVDKVKSVFGSSLIAYYPMDELTGTTAIDASGHGYNGTYNGVTLGQTGIGDGKTCPSFDGSNDHVNIYSAGLAGAMTWQEGTISLWFKVNSVSDWTDSTARKLYYIGDAGAANKLDMYKKSTANGIYCSYYGGSTADAIAFDKIGALGWTHLAITWSLAGDYFKFYINGSQQDTAQTGIGTWAGSPASGKMNIGCFESPTGSNPWKGYQAHWALGNAPLSDAQIAQLAWNNYSGFKLMIEFDDGNASNLDAFNYMLARGLKGNMNIISGLIDTAGFLTHENLQTMDAAGWLILNHTSGVDNLNTLTEAQQETVLTDCVAAFVGWGLSRGNYHVSYPGGVWDANTLIAMANTGMLTGRLFTEITTTVLNAKTHIPYKLDTAWWAKSTNDLASAQTAINIGVARGHYMSVVFHGTGTDGWASGRWSLAKFQSFIDWIVASGIQCVTRDQFWADQ